MLMIIKRLIFFFASKRNIPFHIEQKTKQIFGTQKKYTKQRINLLNFDRKCCMVTEIDCYFLSITHRKCVIQALKNTIALKWNETQAKRIQWSVIEMKRLMNGVDALKWFTHSSMSKCRIWPYVWIVELVIDVHVTVIYTYALAF